MTELHKLFLRSVRLENFRSVHQAALTDLSEYNVLIGRNNSGKSTFLNAIYESFQFLSHAELVRRVPVEHVQELFFQNERNLPVRLQLDGILNADTSFGMSIRITNESSRGPFLWIESIRIGDEQKSLLNWERKTARQLLKLVEDDQARSDDLTTAAQLGQILTRPNHQQPSVQQSLVSEYVGQLRAIAADVEGLPALAKAALSGPTDYGRLSSFQHSLKSSLEVLQSKRQNAIKELRQSVIDPVRSAEFDYFLESLSGVKIYRSAEDREPFTARDKQALEELFKRRDSGVQRRRFASLIEKLVGRNIQVLRDAQDKPVVEIGDYLDTANGSGIRSVLRLLFDLHFSNADLILIEEPELHLHPSLARSLAAHFRSVAEWSQIFLTSHGTEFLDSDVPERHLYVVTHEGSKSEAEAMKYDDAVEAISQAIGIRPSSVFMYDRLVLVEGRHDEEALRSFASVCRINLGSANIGFLHLGGSKSPLIRRAQALLSYLGKRQIRVWCVLDRDEHSEDDIALWAEALKDATNTKLVVWTKRELENYLINIDAMVAQINSKRSRAGLKPDVTDTRVLEERDRLTDTYRTEIQRLRARKRLLPDLHYGSGLDISRMKAAMASMIVALQEADKAFDLGLTDIEAEVKNMDNATVLDRVPGSFALHAIYRHFQVAFRKEDGAGLAASMKKPDVPPEITALLESIAAQT